MIPLRYGNGADRFQRMLAIGLAGWVAGGLIDALAAATLSDPAVDSFNLRVGTQTFAPRYQFTTENKLIETALAIREMGSDTIKFAMGRGLYRQYDIPPLAKVSTLADQARDESTCQRVLEMPFRHYLIWAYGLTLPGDAYWKDGLTEQERQREYREIHDLTRHLLTRYDRSGKRFYLGHWEGDWYLLPNYQTATNPPPQAIQGMIEWLTIRQQAVDDAKRQTPHEDVDVFVYAEVNRVRDAMVGGPDRNQRMINRVIPQIAGLDFVSWSSYDGQNLPEAELFKTLDYIESKLPTDKAAVIEGKRVWVGEYGWGGTLSSDAQEPPTRQYLQRLLQWGCRFILFWELYDNENKAYWLIDRHGVRTPCYQLHQRFYNLARLSLGEFKQRQGRLPNDTEFAALVAPHLNNPLPAPVRLQVTHGPAQRSTPTSAVVQATVEQGIYGDDLAVALVCWGRQDGGTNFLHWEHCTEAGVTTRFGPVQSETSLAPLVPDASYYYRVCATNAHGAAWAPASSRVDGPAPSQPRAQR